jgi:hydroxymethylbilane synthase
MSSQIPIRIGTRGSPLALAQARETRERLAAAHPALAAPDAVEITVIRTSGDMVQDRPLAEIGGKGLFTKEIEEALAQGRIDLAVHSMKDMPTILPEGLAILALLPREDPRDVLFRRDGRTGGLATLAPGAVVGTSSLRRQAQILARRPDLAIVPFRGNVDTRLRKLGEGRADATVLALAGLRRLGQGDRAMDVLSIEEMLPAVAQGAIGLEGRIGDRHVEDLVAALHDSTTGSCVAAERALLAALDGSCRTPIAALAELSPGGRLSLRALTATPDGRRVVATSREGGRADAVRLGEDAGAELRARLPDVA